LIDEHVVVEFRFKDPESPKSSSGINYLKPLFADILNQIKYSILVFQFFPLAPIGCRFNQLFNQVKKPPLGNFFSQANLKKSNTLIKSDDYFQHQGLIEDSGLFCIVNYFVNNLQ